MANTLDRITDTFNSTNPNVARVAANRAVSGTTLQADNLAGWPTISKVHFSTYKLDASNKLIAGSQRDWSGIVTGTNIGSLVLLAGGADSGNVINDVIEMNPTGSWGHDLFTGLNVVHNLDGSLKAGIVTSTALGSGSVTTTAIASGAVTSDSIADGTIATVDIANSAITSQKVAPTIINLSPADVGVVNSTSADVTGGSTTLTLPTASNVIMSFSARQQRNVGDFQALALNVDGSDVRTVQLRGVAGSTVTADTGSTYIATLPAGSHTIKLRYTANSTGNGVMSQIVLTGFIVGQ